MGTVTVSVHLPESEAARLERAAGEMGVDWGEVTLSRAAEIADLSVRSMIFELQHHGLELSYGVNDLAEDLAIRPDWYF